MICAVEFFVPGRARPQGSKKAFMAKGGRFPVVVESSPGLKPWRTDVASHALFARQQAGAELLVGAVEIGVAFAFLRPLSHLLTGGGLRKGAPMRPQGPPDIDKLARGIFDSLTGILFRDDSLVVRCLAEKIYTRDRPGAFIRVQPADDRLVMESRHLVERHGFHEIDGDLRPIDTGGGQ